MTVDNRFNRTLPTFETRERSDREGREAERQLRIRARQHHTDRVCEVTLAGALAGSAAGAVAGPPGALVGAVLGAIVGAMAGAVLDEEGERDRIRNARLDRVIGVFGGEIGAASPSQPASKRHFISAASAGAGGIGGPQGSEGPISSPQD
jgi:hypothetical protein